MVDLNLINQANDNDKIAHRNLWARFFKATKWEELHMLATQDKYIDEAALRVHRLVQDQIFRDKLWAREDYLRCQRDREAYYQGKIDVLEKSKLASEATIATQKAEIADKNTTIADMAAKIAALEAQLAGKNSEQ